MRLDKYLSTHSAASRKSARVAIKQGQVCVNGVVVKDHGTHVAEEDEVSVSGNVLEVRGEVYLALHKPCGVVSATQDEEFETVVDLVDGISHKDLHLAGRLDRDTTGLVLLTSDGVWSHRVTSPNFFCEKVYVAELADPLGEDAQRQLQEGVMLRGEVKPTLRAKLDMLEERQVRLTITEGRYHQVKRMFAAVGNKVESLHREQIGAVALGDLGEGECRELTADEVKSFFKK